MLRGLLDRLMRNREPWLPSYRVTPTDGGADVNYGCYCGCEAGFAFERSLAGAEPSHCCCGNAILVGREAEGRLLATLPVPSEYRIDVRPVAMPWGESAEVALAIPREADTRR